jgi:hypothetical protein
MVDVRRASWGLMVALTAALPMWGCGDSTTTCAPDTPQSDASTAPETRPRVDSAGGGTDARGGGGNGALGATCAAPTDCQTGLTCFRATDDFRPGQGPPNGMCTRDCTADADNSGCRPFGGTCVQFSTAPEKAFCVETCQLSGTTSKCHGRNDVVCESLVDNAGAFVLSACLPVCTDDADCGTRKCDFGTGLCADQPTTGLPNGSPCTAGAECIGQLCLDASPEGSTTKFGVCSGFCRFGGQEGCGFRRTGPVNESGGACGVPVPQPNGAAPGNGDEGYCLEVCDTDADCAAQSPTWGCLNDPALIRIWNHGLCLPRDPVAADAGREAATVDAARDVAPGPAEAAASTPDAGPVVPEAGAD